MNKLIFKDAQGEPYEYNGSEIKTRLGCYGVILNNQNQILLQKERNKRGWMFPGGGWNKVETFQECVKREVLEETGYSITHEEQPFYVLNSPAYFRTPKTYVQKVDLLFFSKLESSKKQIKQSFDSNECIEEMRWFSLDEFKELELGWSFAEIKEIIFQKIR